MKRGGPGWGAGMPKVDGGLITQINLLESFRFISLVSPLIYLVRPSI